MRQLWLEHGVQWHAWLSCRMRYLVLSCTSSVCNVGKKAHLWTAMPRLYEGRKTPDGDSAFVPGVRVGPSAAQA